MKKTCVVIIAFILLFSTSCSRINKNMDTAVEREGFHMGTVISVKIYGEKAKEAADEVFKRIAEIESIMTINEQCSEIGRLNEQSGKNSVKLSSESIYVLEKAKAFSKLSEGAFDVTIGPLVKAWGVFTDNPRIPPRDEIKNYLKLVNYNDLHVDSRNLTAYLAKENQVVDLGGIAKGYAGDEAVKILKKYNIKSAFVNLGGNVVVHGKKPDGSPWVIGVQNPRAVNGKIIGTVRVSDKAVVSSGDYERFFEKDGIRYHHILDPRTGYPSRSGLIGTTVISDLSIDADALSTSIFVLGLDKGMKLIENIKGVEAIFVTSDKKVYTTSGLKDIFIFKDESKEFAYVEKR